MGFLNIPVDQTAWQSHGWQVKQGVHVLQIHPGISWEQSMRILAGLVVERERGLLNVSPYQGQVTQLANQAHLSGQACSSQLNMNMAKSYLTSQNYPDPSLSPTVPTLDPIRVDDSGTYRVPVYHDPEHDLYVIWTGRGALRRLSTELLPDFIKTKMGMINAHSDSQSKNNEAKVFIDHLGIFINTFPESFSDVGWRVSKYYYCLVMTSDQLDDVVGTYP